MVLKVTEKPFARAFAESAISRRMLGIKGPSLQYRERFLRGQGESGVSNSAPCIYPTPGAPPRVRDAKALSAGRLSFLIGYNGGEVLREFSYMIRILLLDCSSTLAGRLKAQGFDVESGTVGFSTGVRLLPSQVYEQNILIYNPTSALKLNDKYVEATSIKDYSPEYSLKPLQDHILNGATFLIFVNRVSEEPKSQNTAYDWIPFMPGLSPTKDKVVRSNSFQDYPDSDCEYLAPVVTVAELDIPVLQKIQTPPRQEFHHDIFSLFWNAHGEDLGLLMKQ